MRVRATKLGYYGLRRRHEGEIFRLKDPKDFSENWMTKKLTDDDELDMLEGFEEEAKDPVKAKKGKAQTSDRRLGDSEVI